MAVFEQRSELKVTLDDTTPLTCTIESAQSLKDYTEYVIRVQRGLLSENTWTVTRRYSDFVALDGVLKPSGIDLHLPPKKVFGNMNREFIAERQLALQSYLNRILEQPYLACHLSVKRFLDPHNYSSNLQEIALQQISMFVRSDNEWEVQEPLPEMGLRLRKQYFAIKNKNQPKEKYVLSWANFGPDKFLPNNHLVNLLKIFPTLQHPNVAPVISVTSNDSCGMAIRSFHEEGTLRDIMCKAKPKAGYLKKYGNPKERVACHINAVKLFGRQILETIKFLHDKGIPYGHLHAGNVLIIENQVKLIDLENWLLGLPCHLRSYIVQFRKINTMEQIDVYCFGHLMYEMLVGETLKSPSCVTFPASCTPEARAILEAILSPEACKNGLPTVDDLLTQPLFRIMLPASEKPQFKIPSKLKEALRDAKAALVKRLHEEQKIYHQQKRISKAQAFHMSEEEKNKRRRSKKKLLNMNGQDKDSSQVGSSATEEKEPMGNGVASSASPPPPAPPAAPPPPPPPGPPGVTITPTAPPPSGERGALLSSICGFNKGALKKSETMDKSSPCV